jgi:hypothetical protein
MGCTPQKEREIANHPSLKPQSFLRQVVYAALPLGEGVIVDTSNLFLTISHPICFCVTMHEPHKSFPMLINFNLKLTFSPL